MKILTSALILITLSSCAVFNKRDKQRAIQSEIISSLTTKNSDFAQCAKENKLFKLFKTKRIRTVLSLTLNERGQIDSFKLDKKKYPDSFSECVFNIVDLISFPKLNENQQIEFDQPFIFSKK